MGLTYQQAVEQTITGAEQFHQIVNGSGATEVVVEDGSTIPSVRKALLDNFYFKDPISWVQGSSEVVFNQLRKFTDGTLWYSPFATTSSPVPMGTTPIGDSNWFIYSFDAVTKLTPQLREALRRSYADSGYNLVTGSFEKGATLNVNTDVLLHELTGLCYSWGSTFPKTVPANSTPTPISPSGWINKSNNNLRTDILNGFSVQRNGKLVLESIVSITDFDGVDDFNGTTGTNNLTAFSKAVTYLNSVGGGTLKLPHTQTGVYFINGDDPTQLTSTIRLDPAQGVSLNIIYSGGSQNSPLVNTSLQTTRQLPIYFQNFGFTSFVGAKVTTQLGEILPTVNNGDGVYAVPELLDGSDFNIYSLPNTVSVVPPVSSTGDSITYNGAGLVRGGATKAQIGDEVFSLISSPTAGVFFAGVTTATGYSYVSQNTGTQEVTLLEVTEGLSNLILGVQYAYTLNQQRDLFNNSLLSVKITSDRSFSVLVNGLVVYSHTTKSSITGVVFGTQNINDVVYISQMSIVRKSCSFGGAKALRILMVGDSITDNNVQYSHAKYLQMLLGTAGISVREINNIAVAGQTAAQQYAILQTIGVGYDIACIQVGVNDIQGSTNFNSFVTTIVNMVNYCKSVGTTPIVALPTSFYSKAEANANGQSGGQNTANNNQIHTYRALLIRAVASAGGILNLETAKSYGAMSAKWLSVQPYSVSDRLVVDNIHPTPYASMMLAQGWARSIIGWLNKPDTTKAESFTTISSSWLSSGFGLVDKPMIRCKELKGTLSLHATNNNDGAVAMTLPNYIRPSALKVVPVTALNTSYLPVGVCNMYIGPNGNVYFFNLPSGTIKVQVDGVVLD